ncbi:MAG TPA: hypothetical protein VM265_05920 [Sphingomicrobium sp.]|nr:hypothetical protein [Sphingomicrobium sp.]
MMFFALDALGPSFDLNDWRASLAARRMLVRSMVAEAVGGGRQLEVMIEEIKRAVRYDMMSDQDQNSFRVMAYNARTIVGGWSKISPHERDAFLSGKTPYSSVAKLVKERS